MATLGVSVGLLALGGVGGAVADGQIGSGQIKNNSITTADIQNGSLRVADLRPEAVEGLMKGKIGPKGDQGVKGDKGDTGDQGASGLTGAYYSVAYYDVGDTNAGAIATVACSQPTDVAISGGIQTLGLQDGALNHNTPVSNSFPGRMDFSTNTPKPGRLDGWIIQFGGNAGAVSDTDPLKTKIWALCVPGATIPVTQTYTESD